MDIETLTNHISGLGKHYFENACKIVLQDVFNLTAVNVDGKNDGGTDYSSFTKEGERINACYQITTQKSAIHNKAYNDAKKAIDKLNVSRFFFLTSFILEEIETRKIEHTISTELNIQATCLSARSIAGLLLSDNLLNKFLDETNYPLPKSNKSNLDYRELALHSYTLLSDDANKMKFGIYDDTVVFILSEKKELQESSLVQETIAFLELEMDKEDIIKRRIGALFGKQILKKNGEMIMLSPNVELDSLSRKRIYEIELSSLSAAQVDIMHNEFSIDWTREDSKKVALWIANAFIAEQIKNLKEVKASIVANPLFDLEKNGLSKLGSFLTKEKKVLKENIDEIIEKLLENASNHPLITKLSRASIYLALEGGNPISSAKALGANRWSDFNILIEPTVAIPYICSLLYKGSVNRYFDCSTKAIAQANKLDASLYIPYFYINECAGHLLKARKYIDIDVDEHELVYSNNAFVSNYFALKLSGENVPSSFLDYLSSFSSAVRTERADIKSWVRTIMTDIQSILSGGGVEFIDVPLFKDGDCAEFEEQYLFYLKEFDIDKKMHLIKHDTYALQFTNNEIVRKGEHWIILTYDKSMIAISKNDFYKGWITNPFKFIDFTQISRPLSETKLVSLVHSVATYSEKTLSIGARIIDRVVKYASKEMQNWEFKQEVDKFKQEIITSIDIQSGDFSSEIDRKTDEFLEKHGYLNKAADILDIDEE